MKYMYLILFLAGSFLPVFAQQFSLKGKVTDQNKQALEFVFASLMKNDSVQVKHTTTDSLGNFSMVAEKGMYRLVLKQFGTELISREIVLQQDTDLGEMVVEGSAALEMVTVAGKKKLVEQKIDRLVFHVENSTSATGGTALDALKAAPMVRVQNDQVSIVGKGEVLVMIDDRLQKLSADDLASLLKSIPADNIQSIEVITTPPAKYDAEGNNGLINIRLKKARANSWDATLGASYTQKMYAGENVKGLFHYNRNKISLQASVNKGSQKTLGISHGQIFYPDELWDMAVKNKTRSEVLGLGFGLDYKVTSKWTTGINYLGSFTDMESGSNPMTYRSGNETKVIHSYIQSKVNARSTPGMNTLNWYHTLALDSSGKKVSVDFDYFNYTKKDSRFFSGNELDAQQNAIGGTFFSATNTNRNQIRNYSGKADVALPYKWGSIDLGAKISHTLAHNVLEVYDHQSGTPVWDSGQSNVFSYKESNEALYVSTSKKLGKKWETQIGLRMEATQTEGYSKNLDQTNQNKYIKLFPTAYVTYVPNDTNSFSLNYSRRIRRPDFDYLNPFVIRTSPYYYSQGNPFLKPSFIDNLEFSYAHKQKWFNSVYFSKISNFGQELSIVDASTNVTKSTPLNYADTYLTGFSTYYNLEKWTRWSSFTGFNVNYQHVQSKTAIIQSTSGFNGYLYTNNDFTLNKSKTIFIGLNYAYQLPGRYQIFHISSMHMLDVSVKFLFFNKKLSLTVTADDLLNGQRPLITYRSNGIKNNVKNYGDTREFRISVLYKFSGKNEVKSSQRRSGNEDERERAN